MASSTSPTIVLTPSRTAVPYAGGTLDVLVRVQAPDRDANSSAIHARMPLRLSLVVDRSGSMDGQPLEEALRCVDYIATRLQPTDWLSVVLYDYEVQVPVPLAPAGNPAAMREALAGVHSGGSTALFDGWQAGAKQLQPAPAQSLSRVLLLSDGQANQGLCDIPEIEANCHRLASEGVTTTTVGLGRAFNENLMVGMARAGQGQHYYGQTAKDLHDAFDEELALLESLFMRRVRVKLVPGAGVIAEPLGLVRRVDDEWMALSDVSWGAETWLLVRLHAAAVAVGSPESQGERSLLAVTLQGESRDGSEPMRGSAMLSLPQVSVEAWESMTTDELVARRVREIGFAAETRRVREMIEEGEMDKAMKRLAVMEKGVADEPWLALKVQHLRQLAETDAEMASKEMLFASNRLYVRQTARDEIRFCASETNNGEVPAFLRRKGSEGEGRRR